MQSERTHRQQPEGRRFTHLKYSPPGKESFSHGHPQLQSKRLRARFYVTLRTNFAPPPSVACEVSSQTSNLLMLGRRIHARQGDHAFTRTPAPGKAIP